MRTAVFDIETDGLLPELTKVHCLVIHEVGKECSLAYHDHPTLYSNGTIEDGLKELRKFDRIAAHGLVTFDLPAIEALYPHWSLPEECELWDTLVVSRLLRPDMEPIDWARNRNMPRHLRGRHSLEAWGYRLDCRKGDFNDWSKLSKEMLDYCRQDVKTLMKLYELEAKALRGKKPYAFRLEHEFAVAIKGCMEWGFTLDEEKALALTEFFDAEIAKIDTALADEVPPWEEHYVTPKKKLKRVRIRPFNAGSRQQVARYLMETHGWKPTEHTDSGQVKVTGPILQDLPYPFAPEFARRFLLRTRLAEIGPEKGGLLAKAVDGIVHGYIDHNGANTHRCIHSNPNMGNMASPRSFMGKEVRQCLIARPGNLLVGVDASGLELRGFAHYLWRFDSGNYVSVVSGDQDVHTYNQGIIEVPDRDTAKTFIYALIYGAGFAKLGMIVGKGAPDGRRLKNKLLKGLPGYKELVAEVSKRIVRSGGILRAVDGRPLHARKEHSALNLLLQSFGAIVVKQATVNCIRGLEDEFGWVYGHDFGMPGHVHDECQFDLPIIEGPDLDRATEVLVTAFQAVQAQLSLNCPIEAKVNHGRNWYDTH